MLVAVISDSHNSEVSIANVKKYINKADIVLFLGDGENDIDKITEDFKGKVYKVSGNCDFSGVNPSEQLIILNGKRIFMCHGHKYGVNYGLNSIYYRGREVEADVVLFGHTHIPLIEHMGDMIIMNPGSMSLGRGIRKRTLGYLKIVDKAPIEAIIKDIEMSN